MESSDQQEHSLRSSQKYIRAADCLRIAGERHTPVLHLCNFIPKIVDFPLGYSLEPKVARHY